MNADNNRIQVSGIDIQWNVEDGECTFEKLPVVMIWIDTSLAGLFSGVQAMVGTKRYLLALQSEGRKSVADDWKAISQFPDFHDGFKAIANIAAVAGWGQWELVSLDIEKKEACFRIHNVWEGTYQKALGVCWGSGFLAGKVAGYCTELFQTNCWAEQTAYIAGGDSYDEFVVKPSTRSIEVEMDNLLASDEATRADMAVALRKLEKEVAERKRTEEALKRSEANYRSIFNAVNDAIFVHEMETGRILDVNKKMCEMYGYTPEEVVHLNVEDLSSGVSPYTQEDAFKWIKKAIDGDPQLFEWMAKDKSGRLFWVEVNLKRVKIEDRDRLLAVVRDITERKQSEKALHESEELFRVINTSALDAVILIDDTVKVVLFNPAAE